MSITGTSLSSVRDLRDLLVLSLCATPFATDFWTGEPTEGLRGFFLIVCLSRSRVNQDAGSTPLIRRCTFWMPFHWRLSAASGDDPLTELPSVWEPSEISEELSVSIPGSDRALVSDDAIGVGRPSGVKR